MKHNRTCIVSKSESHISVKVIGQKLNISTGWVHCERRYDIPFKEGEAEGFYRSKALLKFKNSYN